MSSSVRIGISIESDLLEEIDRLCSERRFASRSEGFRQLCRAALLTSAWHSESCQAVATLTLIYHCSCPTLSRRLKELQHTQRDLIVSVTRAHLDCDTSLEVMILKGSPGRLKTLASQLCGLKGVHTGKLEVATALQQSANGTNTDRTWTDHNDSMHDVLKETEIHLHGKRGLR